LAQSLPNQCFQLSRKTKIKTKSLPETEGFFYAVLFFSHLRKLAAMKYHIESEYIFIELNRSLILDISPGDELESASLDGSYIWTAQDMQFVESNPDARIFIKFEKKGSSFKGKGLMVVPQEVY
jgi:hypothetical protein